MPRLQLAPSLILALILTCMLPSARAWNEAVRLADWEAVRGERETSSSSRAGALSLNLASSWRRDLERSGALSRVGPYRVALPLASFGDNGPRLLLTYMPRARDGLGADRSLMLFLRINLD